MLTRITATATAAAVAHAAYLTNHHPNSGQNEESATQAMSHQQTILPQGQDKKLLIITTLKMKESSSKTMMSHPLGHAR